MFKCNWLLGAIAAIAMVGSISTEGFATSTTDTVVSFGVWPHTSTGGIPAVQTSPPHTPFVYSYSIQSGAAFSDTIPISVCLETETVGDLTTWTDQVVANNVAGGLPDVTVPASPWTFTQSSAVSLGGHDNADPGCQTGSININVPSGVLTSPGINVYTTNVIFGTNNSNKSGNPPHLKDGGNVDTPHIQIQVSVAAATAPPIACFMTDSDGNLLTDCKGNAVTASDSEDGTFAIVSNKKGTAVSTNPGQFYYNLLWQNDTGTDQTVNVNMVPSGLSPNGAQAVHWLNFPTAGFSGVTPADFDDVIVGNPAGTSGTINNITVPAGDTLYVTYHLEWSGTGHAAPDCGACGTAGNISVSVAGSVSGGFANSPDNCTSGALGYNKQQ